MELTKEQQKELAKFSPLLRELIDAELAAGNRITELGHGFPAPPIGAYLLLERKVSTRARAAGGGLGYRERQSSTCSGEFSDAERVYFVLEPPDPPPPEPDMDAIRKALEPKPDPLVALAERRAAGFSPRIGADVGVSAAAASSRPAESSSSAGASRFTELASGCTYELQFRDTRTPHELRCAFERDLCVLFAEAEAGETLCWRTQASVVGARYRFELRFEVALPEICAYSLRIDASWEGCNAANEAYYRKTSRSWIELWTRELVAAPLPSAGEGSPERTRALTVDARTAEAHLDSIAAIQTAIVAGMRRGGRYASSHKEGGSNIVWRGKQYVRTDYGDDPAVESFAEDAAFLAMLRRFCHLEVMRWAGPEGVAEIDAWKLILRRMLPG
jgi:hypothetical protein